MVFLSACSVIFIIIIGFKDLLIVPVDSWGAHRDRGVDSVFDSLFTVSESLGVQTSRWVTLRLLCT